MFSGMTLCIGWHCFQFTRQITSVSAASKPSPRLTEGQPTVLEALEEGSPPDIAYMTPGVTRSNGRLMQSSAAAKEPWNIKNFEKTIDSGFSSHCQSCFSRAVAQPGMVPVVLAPTPKPLKIFLKIFFHCCRECFRSLGLDFRRFINRVCIFRLLITCVLLFSAYLRPILYNICPTYSWFAL